MHKQNILPDFHLGVQITLSCPLNCAHCAFQCGPNRKEWLDKEVARNIADTCDPKMVISITGGEPLVDMKKLKEYLFPFKKKGFKLQIITSAFWATTNENTLNVLKGLVECGVSTIAMSVDRFHVLYVPLKNVSRVIKVARQSQIPITISLLSIDGDSALVQKVRKNTDKASVSVKYQPLMNSGRAENMKTDQVKMHKTKSLQHPCPAVFSPVVMVDGSVYLCCSGYLAGNSLLCAGKIGKDDSLSQLFSSPYLSLLQKYLALFGALRLRKEIGGNISTANYNTTCHPCLELFGNKDNEKRILSFLSEEKNKQYINYLTDALGKRS